MERSTLLRYQSYVLICTLEGGLGLRRLDVLQLL